MWKASTRKCRDYTGRLKKKYFLTPQQGQNDIFESSELMLLLVNSHGIFEVDWMRNVREYSQLAVIGTGDEYALGAMKALYEHESDPTIIVSKGIEAAAKFDQKNRASSFLSCCQFRVEKTFQFHEPILVKSLRNC